MPARFADTWCDPNEAQLQPGSLPSCQLMVFKDGNRKIWSLGSKFVLKDRGYYPGSEVEVQNTNYAAEWTNGTVAAIVTSWREADRFFMIQERIEGQSLEAALPRLSQTDLARIGQQLGHFLLQLRGIGSPTMEMLNGQPVIDRRLFKPLPNFPAGQEYSVCSSNDEVAANMALALTGKLDCADTLSRFLARMPSAMPFTFSHSDVHEGNIMVKDGQFVGLIDWELAGFYPCWWEFVNSCELLSDHLPDAVQDSEALAWFRVYHAIRERPGEEETTKMLQEYVG